ncbi:MAG TPA: PhzF family phenazine biosynthesis protein [Stellaceae bacterium]|jgi:PhzF family phenazine biosynthesis protein|nr:PhzF family phenazine biosynthesis protein [Stellaceae bacterium]
MRLKLYQIDAFADRLFAGNPAAVVPLEEDLPEVVMQAIAAENNLAETAFFRREGEAYALRWFTPTVEVELCGHATLASAYVIFRHLEPGRDEVRFSTRKAGMLGVNRDGEVLALDFPAFPPEPCAPSPGLAAALGAAPQQLLCHGRRFLAVFSAAAKIAALAPDFAALRRWEDGEVIVTAPGEGEIDFVSRFFAPGYGIDEDPVTGSAHSVLTPYWAKRLGKERLSARQISRRGGALLCTLQGERVAIAGRCVPYLEGWITV